MNKKQSIFKFICVYFALMLFPYLTASETSPELEYLRKLPKAELHLHLGGAYPLPYLLSIATPKQAEELQSSLALIAKRVSYRNAFRFFQVIAEIIDTEEKVQKGVEALCHFFKEDGVVYAEIRTGLKNLGKGYEAYLKAVLEGMRQASSSDCQTKLCLSLQRNSSPEMAKMTVDLALKYRDFGVVGIDISGDSCTGPVEQIMPALLYAKQKGLPVVVHIGESPDETDQLYLLENLHPIRVGHGVHLTTEAKAWIAKRRIPLEVCLTSSVLVEMVADADQHPGLRYFQEGHPIILCSDDPLLFSTTLSQEFLMAHKSGLSLEELTKIGQDAFQYTLISSP